MLLALPAGPAATSTPAHFETLLETAMRSDPRNTRDYALDFGVDEKALIRYADGAICDEGERRSIERVVSRNRWSQNFIVERVKQKRKRKTNEGKRNAA